MAELDKKISQLEEKASLTGEEYVALADNTRNYKAKVKNIGGVIPSGGTADRPENPVVGTQYFDTDLGKVVTWDGSEWVEPAAGQGTVLLHVDTGSATEDGETTTYRFTETQEEINAIIDKAAGAEVVNATVVIDFDEGLVYSVPMFLQKDGDQVGYVGYSFGNVILVVMITNIPGSMMMKRYGDSAMTYLSAGDFQKYQGGEVEDGYYINDVGQKVADENYEIIHPFATSGGVTFYAGTVFKVITDTYMRGVSVFSRYTGYETFEVLTEASQATYVVPEDMQDIYISRPKGSTIIQYSSDVFSSLCHTLSRYKEDTLDMMGINGRMQQLTPEVAQEGKYYNLSGEVADNVGYNISAPVSLNEGDTLLVKSVSFAKVAMIKDADGNIVPARSTTQDTPTFYSYTATKATTVEISYRNDGSSLFYKFNSSVFEQLAKQITANKGGDSGNLLLELPYLTGNFSTPTLGSGITDMPTLVAKIKAAKSVMLRNPSEASCTCSYWNVYGGDTAVRLITVADTLNQENVLRSNVQITYTASTGNFSVNIVPETVTNTLVLKFPTFDGVWNTATLADGIDDMAALLDRLASHPVVLLQSGDNEFRQCLRYVTNSDEQRVYFYTVGNKINGQGGNIYTVFNVTYDTEAAQFRAELANYPDENGGNVKIVTELPETPDENTVYIIKGS